MASAGDIFLNSTDLMNNTHNYLIIHHEARDIEHAILFAADNGLFQVTVSNTVMTNTVLPAVQNITSIDLVNSKFILNNHSYLQGAVVEFNSTGTLPDPISAGTQYYVIFVDANTFRVATSAQNAAYGIYVVLTSAAETTSIGTNINPTFTAGSVIIINGVTVTLTGTNLAQTITDINNPAAVGTNANPTFVVSSAIVIEGHSVVLTGTTLAQTVIDINTAAIPNVVASQLNSNYLIIRDTSGTTLTISGAAATVAGMPASTTPIPNIIASQTTGNNLVLTDTIGTAINTSGAGATAAGMTASTPAPVISVQAVSDAEQFYNVWKGLTTDAAKTFLMNQVMTHFTNLGYTIIQQQNPQVPQVFQWVVSW